MKKILFILILCLLPVISEATVIGPGVPVSVFSSYTSVGRVTLEQVQDNIGGTVGGDGFIKSADGHLTISYSDSTPSLVLGVIGSICNYPTGIEFGSATQQYDVTGTTFVSAIAGGSLGGIPASSAGNTLANAIDSITTARDNKYLVVQEKSGVASSTNPLTVQFLFTNITTFNTINTRSFYTGSIAHNMSIQLWNYTTSAWDTYGTFSGETDYVSRSLEVFNHTPYVSGGNVKLQFIHLSTGVATHDIRFDYVALCDGGGGGGSASIASAVAYTPTGGIAAANVQTAINELDVDKMNTDYSNAGTAPTWNQNTTGTATALAVNGTNCSASQAAIGVSASGDAEGCWTVSASNIGLGNVNNKMVQSGSTTTSATIGTTDGVYYSNVAITFASAFPDTNYSISGSTSFVGAWVSAIASQTTTGCTIYISGITTGAVASRTIYWIATQQ